METLSALPAIDKHEISVDAPADAAWASVLAVFTRFTTLPPWRAYAMAIRCRPDRATQAPDQAGATVPGFRVARFSAPTEWALEGEHLFSRYALTFRVAALDTTHCRITAESSAEFPGLHGRLYRALVIGTGGHVIGVRGLLRSIKAEAERKGQGADRTEE